MWICTGLVIPCHICLKPCNIFIESVEQEFHPFIHLSANVENLLYYSPNFSSRGNGAFSRADLKLWSEFLEGLGTTMLSELLSLLDLASLMYL